MSDDLVKRLRLGACALEIEQAADRIEEVEAENKRLRLEVHHANDVADAAIEGAKELKAQRAKAVDAIEGLLAILPDDEGPEIDYARTALAELKGENQG